MLLLSLLPPLRAAAFSAALIVCRRHTPRLLLIRQAATLYYGCLIDCRLFAGCRLGAMPLMLMLAAAMISAPCHAACYAPATLRLS